MMTLSSESRLVRWTFWSPWMGAWRDTNHREAKYRAHDAAWTKVWAARAKGDLASDFETFYTVPPYQTNLCLFFWQAFLLATLSNIVWGVIMVIYTILLYGVATPLVWAWLRLPEVEVRGRAETFANKVLDPLATKLSLWGKAARESVFVQGLRTLKGKVCPLIVIKE